ncbi:MAG: hypothetical protein IPJ37_17245 [Bacteroidales bacterium]|nr:hypothetical protein [Bacteroidales bacterium]
MKKSEHMVRDYLNTPSDVSPASLQKTLKACRTELEQSNKELKLVREQAVGASQKYSELYDFRHQVI